MKSTLNFSLIILASITILSCGLMPGISRKTSNGVLFTDDFNRRPLKTAKWVVGEGRWNVTDGKLKNYRHKQTVAIWARQSLTDNYQIDFDATGGNFSIFLNGLGEGNALDNCYHVGIGVGSAGNSNIIQRLGKTVAQDKENLHERGKWFHVTITMTDGILKVMLDGKVILEYKDNEPLTGTEHRYVALGGDWAPDTTVQFDNFVIGRL